MNLEELFKGGALTYAQFDEALKTNGVKLADLSKGEYVAKKKYDDDLKAKDSTIAKLNGDITTRDTDLNNLKTQLAEAGTNADKLSQLTNDLSALQGKYDTEVKNYKKQLEKQAYEFAVKDFASTKKFTSNAAKRDFVSSMIAKELKMDGDKILGAEDFVSSYTVNNADAFVVEDTPQNTALKPTFVSPTTQEPPKKDVGAFDNAFNFVGVRPHDIKK